RRLGEGGLLPHPHAPTANGQTLWQNCEGAPIYDDEVIRKLDAPLVEDGGICILRGNLAPRGAVLKPSAASKHLMTHRGRAVVFEDFDHYKARIDDPDLDVDENSVLVMKNCGPKGYPGMADRLETFKPPVAGGYQGLYLERVLQADEGCDFDFLVGCRGSAVPKHSH